MFIIFLLSLKDNTTIKQKKQQKPYISAKVINNGYI